MAERKNMLSVEGLTKTYGERRLFSSLTFGVQEGERVALVARNGSGKSTLLKAICGLEPADEGRVVFSSGVRHGHLRQELELQPEATILDTLYIGDSPAVQAMREVRVVLPCFLARESEASLTTPPPSRTTRTGTSTSSIAR